jgi:hypothetical protein
MEFSTSNVLDLRGRLVARNCPVGAIADHAELGTVDVLAANGLQREVSYVVERTVPPLGDDPTVLYHEEVEYATTWVHVSTLSERSPRRDGERRDWNAICALLENRWARQEEPRSYCMD